MFFPLQRWKCCLFISGGYMLYFFISGMFCCSVWWLCRDFFNPTCSHSNMVLFFLKIQTGSCKSNTESTFRIEMEGLPWGAGSCLGSTIRLPEIPCKRLLQGSLLPGGEASSQRALKSGEIIQLICEFCIRLYSTRKINWFLRSVIVLHIIHPGENQRHFWAVTQTLMKQGQGQRGLKCLPRPPHTPSAPCSITH